MKKCHLKNEDDEEDDEKDQCDAVGDDNEKNSIAWHNLSITDDNIINNNNNNGDNGNDNDNDEDAERLHNIIAICDGQFRFNTLNAIVGRQSDRLLRYMMCGDDSCDETSGKNSKTKVYLPKSSATSSSKRKSKFASIVSCYIDSNDRNRSLPIPAGLSIGHHLEYCSQFLNDGIHSVRCFHHRKVRSQQIINDIIDDLDLSRSSILDRTSIETLSDGERKRVEIAQSLIRCAAEIERHRRYSTYIWWPKVMNDCDYGTAKSTIKALKRIAAMYRTTVIVSIDQVVKNRNENFANEDDNVDVVEQNLIQQFDQIYETMHIDKHNHEEGEVEDNNDTKIANIDRLRCDDFWRRSAQQRNNNPRHFSWITTAIAIYRLLHLSIVCDATHFIVKTFVIAMVSFAVCKYSSIEIDDENFDQPQPRTTNAIFENGCVEKSMQSNDFDVDNRTICIELSRVKVIEENINFLIMFGTISTLVTVIDSAFRWTSRAKIYLHEYKNGYYSFGAMYFAHQAVTCFELALFVATNVAAIYFGKMQQYHHHRSSIDPTTEYWIVSSHFIGYLLYFMLFHLYAHSFTQLLLVTFRGLPHLIVAIEAAYCAIMASVIFGDNSAMNGGNYSKSIAKTITSIVNDVIGLQDLNKYLIYIIYEFGGDRCANFRDAEIWPIEIYRVETRHVMRYIVDVMRNIAVMQIVAFAVAYLQFRVRFRNGHNEKRSWQVKSGGKNRIFKFRKNKYKKCVPDHHHHVKGDVEMELNEETYRIDDEEIGYLSSSSTTSSSSSSSSSNGVNRDDDDDANRDEEIVPLNRTPSNTYLVLQQMALISWRHLRIERQTNRLLSSITTTTTDNRLKSLKIEKNCRQISVEDGELRFGSLNGLIGESGSGKSILLKLICGVLSPADGLVAVSEDCKFSISQYAKIYSCYIDGSSRGVIGNKFCGLTARQTLIYASMLRNRDHQSLVDHETTKSIAVSHRKLARKMLRSLHISKQDADRPLYRCDERIRRLITLGQEIIGVQILTNLICIDGMADMIGGDRQESDRLRRFLYRLTSRKNVAIFVALDRFDLVKHNYFENYFDQLFHISNDRVCDLDRDDDDGGEDGSRKKCELQSPATPSSTISSSSSSMVEVDNVPANRIRFSPKAIIVLIRRSIVNAFARSKLQIALICAIPLAYGAAIRAIFVAQHTPSLIHSPGCINFEEDFNHTCSVTDQFRHDVSSLIGNVRYQFFAINIFAIIVSIISAGLFRDHLHRYIGSIEYRNRSYSTGAFYAAISVIDSAVQLIILPLYVAIINVHDYQEGGGGGQGDDFNRKRDYQIFAHLLLIHTLRMLAQQSLDHMVVIAVSSIGHRNIRNSRDDNDNDDNNNNHRTIHSLILMNGFAQTMLANFFIPLDALHYSLRFLANLVPQRYAMEAIVLLLYGFQRCEKIAAETRLPLIQPLLFVMQIEDADYRSRLLTLVAMIVVYRLIAFAMLMLFAANRCHPQRSNIVTNNNSLLSGSIVSLPLDISSCVRQFRIRKIEF